MTLRLEGLLLKEGGEDRALSHDLGPDDLA